MASCSRPSCASVSPAAMRICDTTRSTSVTSSVTVCSTWMRGFISMNTCCAGALARRVEEELDGAGVHVADRLRERDGVAVQRLAHVVGEVRRGCDLDDLLVAALHRAVALEQVHRLARGIRQHLHLDVAGTQHRLLEEHGRVAEGAVGLAHRLLEGAAQVVLRGDAAHAAAPAARDGLREDREADLVGLRDELLDVARGRGRLQHGHAGRDRVLLRGDLVARHLEHVLGRADEGDAGLGGGLRELGVLGEEPVARVDRVRAGLPGDADDLGHVEVGAHRMPRLADLVGLVRLQAMQRVAVLERVDRDGLRAELDGRAERPDGDLPAVGYQDLREHAGLSTRFPHSEHLGIARGTKGNVSVRARSLRQLPQGRRRQDHRDPRTGVGGLRPRRPHAGRRPRPAVRRVHRHGHPDGRPPQRRRRARVAEGEDRPLGDRPERLGQVATRAPRSTS